MPRLLCIRMEIVETVVNLCADQEDRPCSFRPFFRERYAWRGLFKQLESGPYLFGVVKVRKSHSNNYSKCDSSRISSSG